MSETCKKVQDLIIPYVNHLLDTFDVSFVVTHLATCPECRKEAAAIIKLSREVTVLKDVPQDILKCAFEKIYQLEKEDQMSVFKNFNEDLYKIVDKKLPSPSLAYDLISQIFKPIKKSIQLSIENI